MHKSFANSSLHHSIHMFPHISINFSIIFQQNSRRRRVSELYKILPKICIFFSNGFFIVQCYVKMPPQKCVFCADETLWSSFSQKLGSLPRLWRVWSTSSNSQWRWIILTTKKDLPLIKQLESPVVDGQGFITQQKWGGGVDSTQNCSHDWEKTPKLTAGEYVGLSVDYARACLHTRSDAIL